MLENLRALCALDGTSGHEDAVRSFILSHLPDGCDIRTDALGNLIVSKPGGRPAKNTVMLSAHMDEVGIIVTHVSGEGFLRFTTVGGITPQVLAGRTVRFANGTVGAVGLKPIHLCEKDELDTLPAVDKLYIDIGADCREQALVFVKPGDVAVFTNEWTPLGAHRICSKALDDRVGCAVLLDMLHGEVPSNAVFVFTVQEEIGLRGAGTAAFAIQPDYALNLETTTAADLVDVPEGKRVCALGKGAAVSFMDRATLYNPAFYELAFSVAAEKEIPVQPKTMVAGGNDAGSIHKAGAGVRVLTLNTPCRYLHSGSCVADTRDIESVRALAAALLEALGNA